MSEPKTQPSSQSVSAFLGAIPDEARRNDCFMLVELMKHATGAEPRMWGPTMIGFGEYHYRYESGREGTWFLTGFSPRKTNLSLYIMAGFDRYQSLMKGLGRYKTGKSCLYIKKLADVDLEVLRALVTASVEHVRRMNPA